MTECSAGATGERVHRKGIQRPPRRAASLATIVSQSLPCNSDLVSSRDGRRGDLAQARLCVACHEIASSARSRAPAILVSSRAVVSGGHGFALNSIFGKAIENGLLCLCFYSTSWTVSKRIAMNQLATAASQPSHVPVRTHPELVQWVQSCRSRNPALYWCDVLR